jgi:hypothetical protein
MFWMIAASRSFFAAFRSKSNEPKSWSWAVHQNLLGSCSCWTSFSPGWEILRLVDWHLSVSEDRYHFQGSLLWMVKLLNTISSHTPPPKYGLLGFFPLLLCCGLSKSLLPIWLCTPKHPGIRAYTQTCMCVRGDLYTQLFLICTWLLLLWLIFEKKGHVIRNFHSSKT